jgi:hypothetical protein
MSKRKQPYAYTHSDKSTALHVPRQPDVLLLCCLTANATQLLLGTLKLQLVGSVLTKA